MNEENIRKREYPVEPKDANSSASERWEERRRKINCVTLFIFVYFPCQWICINWGSPTTQPTGGMIIGMTIGMRRGIFPNPNLIGRKNFALLTRRERTSSVSVSVCLSVCLKSKCSICVSEGYCCGLGREKVGQRWHIIRPSHPVSKCLGVGMP